MTARSPALPLGRTGRWERPLWLGLTFALLGLMAGEVVVLYLWISDATTGWYIGMDYDFYRALGARWLADGSYYLPHQLAGPYPVTVMVDVLYPPTALVLFVPLVFVPTVTWWAVPIGVIGYALWRWRPSMRAWPFIIATLMWPRSMGSFFHGNTDLWVSAGVAGGLLWGWPAALILLKPVFAPLALLGARRRSWWLAAGLGLASVAVSWSLWLDYVTAMRNLHIGLDYSLTGLPLVTMPLLGWLTSTRERPMSGRTARWRHSPSANLSSRRT